MTPLDVITKEANLGPPTQETDLGQPAQLEGSQGQAPDVKKLPISATIICVCRRLVTHHIFVCNGLCSETLMAQAPKSPSKAKAAPNADDLLGELGL